MQSNTNVSAGPQYPPRMTAPHSMNYAQQMQAGPQLAQYYPTQPMPGYAPGMRFSYFAQQPVPPYHQYGHAAPYYATPTVMNSAPIANHAQPPRRPQYRCQTDGAPTNSNPNPNPQYSNLNASAVESISYPPCNNDSPQTVTPANMFTNKTMPQQMPQLPSPAPHTMQTPNLCYLPMDQSRMMQPVMPPTQMTPFSYPMPTDPEQHLAQMHQFQMMQQQWQNMVQRPPMIPPQNRPDAVHYQDFNSAYRPNVHSHDPNELQHGKESVPPKDPVNVRANGSVTTPQQHSSTTSVASIVSEILHEKAKLKQEEVVSKNEARTENSNAPADHQETSSTHPSHANRDENEDASVDGVTGRFGAKGCTLCQSRQRPESEYMSHCLRDGAIAVCPTLREKVCPKCGATGDYAHDEFFCRKQPEHASHPEENNYEPPSPAAIDKRLAELTVRCDNGNSIRPATTESESITILQRERTPVEEKVVSPTAADSHVNSTHPSSTKPPSVPAVSPVKPEFNYPTQKVWVNSQRKKNSSYRGRGRGGYHNFKDRTDRIAEQDSTVPQKAKDQSQPTVTAKPNDGEDRGGVKKRPSRGSRRFSPKDKNCSNNNNGTSHQ